MLAGCVEISANPHWVHHAFGGHELKPGFQVCKPLRIHVSNNWVLRVLVIVIIVQVLGKSMIIRYLDP